MGDKTGISWTDATWNCVTGCNKISPGCKHCYAETMALRLQRMGQANYKNGFELTLQPHMLEIPLRWKRPRMVFVNSMSDAFHEEVPLSYIIRMFDVMHEASHHTFQILTKRSKRLAEVANQIEWPKNVWMGVSVENADYVHRIDDLRKAPAALRFVSLEPLLGPIPNLDLSGISWCIVGGESGPKARPMDPGWARDIRNQCLETKCAFFFKQMGGRDRKKGGNELDGRIWEEMPAIE